jgi:hypothetical protein
MDPVDHAKTEIAIETPLMIKIKSMSLIGISRDKPPRDAKRNSGF